MIADLRSCTEGCTERLQNFVSCAGRSVGSGFTFKDRLHRMPRAIADFRVACIGVGSLIAYLRVACAHGCRERFQI